MNLDTYSLTSGARGFLAKHHPVLFITLLCLLLAVAVLFLMQVLSLTNVDSSTTGSTIDGFDEKVVSKIRNLHDSSDTTTNLTFPSPRSNPFVENK